MEIIKETNSTLNFNNKNITNAEKKKIKIHPIKIKIKKSESQPNLFIRNKNRIQSSINTKNTSETKNNIDKKLFNNANDYQYLYKDIRNTRFDVLWVRYLRSFPYSPGPVQHLGVSAPSFYEEDLESFRKRFKAKIKKIKKNENDGIKISKWKNLSMSNVLKNERSNEFLPYIFNRNNSYLNNENEENDKNKKLSADRKYLHPFQYKYRKVTMDNGNVVKQKYIKYDDKKTLKIPSLIFSSNKYSDK